MQKCVTVYINITIPWRDAIQIAGCNSETARRRPTRRGTPRRPGRGERLGEKVLKRLRDYSNLAADVVEADALADVPPRLLHHRVPVHVRQEAQAEPARWGDEVG